MLRIKKKLQNNFYQLNNKPISLHALSFISCLSNAILIHLLLIFLEKAMAPHSSTPVWKIPWTEEPSRLQSMGSQRVGHN